MNEYSDSGSNTINKSYSGILGSNPEYSIYFENQEINLNKSELKLELNENSLQNLACKNFSKKSSANSSNTRSDEYLATKHRNKKDNEQIKKGEMTKKRSSTFKSRMNSFENTSKINVMVFFSQNSYLLNNIFLKQKSNPK